MPLRRSASVAEGAGLSSRLLRFKAGAGLGEGGGGHWKDAWLVLHRDSTLRWYNDKTCSRLLGESSVRDVPRRVQLFRPAAESWLPPAPVPEEDEEEGLFLSLPGWNDSEPTAWFWLPDEPTVRSWLHALAAALFKLRVYHLYLQKHEAAEPPIDWPRLWIQIIDFDRDDLWELRASRIALNEDFQLVDTDGAPIKRSQPAPRRLRERKRRRRVRPTQSLSPSRARSSRDSSPLSSRAPSVARSAPAMDSSDRHALSPTPPPTPDTGKEDGQSVAGEDSEVEEAFKSKTPRPLSIEVSAEVHRADEHSADFLGSPLGSPAIHTPGSLGAASQHSALSGSLTEDSFVRSPSGEVFLAKRAEDDENPELVFQMSLPEEEEKAKGLQLYRESFKEEARPHVEVREERWAAVPAQAAAQPNSDMALLQEVAAAMAGPQRVDTADHFATALEAPQAQTKEERGISIILAETRAEQRNGDTTRDSSDEEDKAEEAAKAKAPTRSVRVVTPEDQARQSVRASRVFRYKKGGRLGGEGHWKEGWLVLYADARLAWYNDRHCSVLLGESNVAEFPRRLHLGEEALRSPDVKGQPPTPPGGEAAGGLVAIPAWTATASTTWLYIRDANERREWTASLAAAIGKKKAFDTLLHEKQQGEPEAVRESSASFRQAGGREKEEPKWGEIWHAVIEDGSVEAAGSVRRRKRRSNRPHRAATPSRKAGSKESSKSPSKTASKTPSRAHSPSPARSRSSSARQPQHEVTSLTVTTDTTQQAGFAHMNGAAEDDHEVETSVTLRGSQETAKAGSGETILRAENSEEGVRDSGISTDQAPEVEEDMEALVQRAVQAQEENAARRSAFFASDDSDAAAEAAKEPRPKSAVVQSEGVKVARAETLRRRLQESREMAIRSKLPFPAKPDPQPNGHAQREDHADDAHEAPAVAVAEVNDVSEPPPPVPSSPLPEEEVFAVVHAAVSASPAAGDAHDETLVAEQSPANEAQEAVATETAAPVLTVLPPSVLSSQADGELHAFKPIRAAVETSAVSESESEEAAPVSTSQRSSRHTVEYVNLQSTDAESEEEDRAFIAKELAKRRSSPPGSPAKARPATNGAATTDEDDEGAKTPSASPRASPTPKASVPAEATFVVPKPAPERHTPPEHNPKLSEEHDAPADQARAPSPPPPVPMRDYRRGPLEKLTEVSSSSSMRSSWAGSTSVRSSSSVTSSSSVQRAESQRSSVRMVRVEERSLGGSVERVELAGAQGLASRHASVEALARAQTDVSPSPRPPSSSHATGFEVRVGELERVLAEAKSELGKNQRLREELERERVRLSHAAAAHQSQAYLEARRRQLQDIFDRAQREAAALIGPASSSPSPHSSHSTLL